MDTYLRFAQKQRSESVELGLVEMRRRKLGEAADPEMDRAAAYADYTLNRTDDFHQAGRLANGSSTELETQLNAAWGFFMLPEETSAQILRLARKKNDMTAAVFIMAWSSARKSLGVPYFSPLKEKVVDEAAASERQRLHRLREIWEKEAVVMDFSQDSKASKAEKIKWISELETDSLHEFAFRFNWDGAELDFLIEAVKSKACDKATAMTIYAHSAIDHYETSPEALKDDFGGKLVPLMDLILERVKRNDFKSAILDEPHGLEWHKSFQDQRKAEGKDLIWDFPDHAFTGFGGQKAEPVYEYQGDMLRFLRSFDDWQKLRSVE